MSHKKYPGIHGNRSILSILVLAQEGVCFYCPHRIAIFPADKKERRASLDHRIPIWQLGEPFGFNVVAACVQCNGWKGPLDEATFQTVRAHPMRRKEAVRNAHLQQTPEQTLLARNHARATYLESRQKFWVMYKPLLDGYKSRSTDGSIFDRAPKAS